MKNVQMYNIQMVRAVISVMDRVNIAFFMQDTHLCTIDLKMTNEQRRIEEI